MMTRTTAVAARERWTGVLREIRQHPWRYCPDLPAIAQRWESWWRFDAPRPLLVASVPKAAPIRWGKCFDLLDRPEEWVRARSLQVANTHYVGETIPYVRVDLGPVALASCLGVPLHFDREDYTSWQDPIIEDWNTPLSFRLDENNRWYQILTSLAQHTAQAAVGNYALCVPDLAGAVDVLANMRGSERLCMDLFDFREPIQRAAMELVETWDAVFTMFHEVGLGAGAAVTHWMACWSDIPHTTPTCDFNALVGHEDFVEVCLPSLAEQSRRAGRSLFHLDGPDAARHAQAVAQEPTFSAIQYVPGAGTPSALAKLEMLRMIQKAGKPLWLYCPSAEARELCEKLDPRGLVIVPTDLRSPQEADRMMQLVESYRV